MADEQTAETPPENPPAPAKPAARIVGGPARERVIMLTFPVEFDGKVWDRIVVRRMTAADVTAFMADVATSKLDARLPMLDAPPEVLSALDADDSEEVDRAIIDFLPRALRPEESAPRQTSAATTQASSPRFFTRLLRTAWRWIGSIFSRGTKTPA